MPFNSYEFILGFLPIIVAGFWALARVAGRTGALLWLVSGSIAFYAYAGWKALVIIAPSVLLDYLIASALLRAPSSNDRLRNLLFTTGIVANILFLGYFKYRNFFLGTADVIFSTHHDLQPIIVPLGISFLTFQKIAFLADIKAGDIESVRFLDYLLFVFFFPRTIAGPIIRYNEILPQFRNIALSEIPSHLAVGICLFSIGLFKKVLVADNISTIVAAVFDSAPGPGIIEYSGPPTFLTAWTAVLCYAFQLYFDFSGYSDMALGAARMLGIRLPMNFNSPFKASSITEFWSRWHITLTRFLTAYVYTPTVLAITRARRAKGKAILTGKRSTPAAIATIVGIPTLATMAISGIWHGAGWQFVVWGLMHGIYLTVNQTWRLIHPRPRSGRLSAAWITKTLCIILTFTAVVVALVFFRAASVPSALSILSGMVGEHGLLSNDTQVLRMVGVDLPWSLLVPIVPWTWIAILLLWVMALPNSLELLRPFQPAIDFPEGTHPHAPVPPPHTMPFLRLVGGGIAISRVGGAVVALLCLLGLTALGRGEKFLYMNF